MSPRVDILYFDGCPNHEPTRALVERLAGELNVKAEIELVQVADADAASGLRFLGSPTVRVNGRDVEPGASERHDYGLQCRVYPTSTGLSGTPRDEWVLHALGR